MSKGNAGIVRRRDKFISESMPSNGEVSDYTRRVNNKAVRVFESLITFSHMKQEDIESELGVCRTYLSKVCTGKIELKLSHIIAVCKILEFPVALFCMIVCEEESINWSDFDNELVRRMKRILINIHGNRAEKLGESLKHVFPVEELTP